MPPILRALCFLFIFTSVAVSPACGGDELRPRLPEGVTAAVAYNEPEDRWHLGAIAQGSRDGSNLRLLCIVKGEREPEFESNNRVGLSVQVWLSEDDGQGARAGIWHLDGRRWPGDDWVRLRDHVPPSFEPGTADGAESFIADLANAKQARFTSMIDDQPLLSTSFDTEALLSTPLQSALHDCRPETVSGWQKTGANIYAYWRDDLQTHWYAASLPDANGEFGVFLYCGTLEFLDSWPVWLDDTPADRRVLVIGLATPDRELVWTPARVSWIADGVNAEPSQWQLGDDSLAPPSRAVQMEFYGALRRATIVQLLVEPEAGDAIEAELRTAGLWRLPLSEELHGCAAEYAALSE
ncbi:MAG: hypothetical protein F4066_05455 [Chloroflexi bacterium]|nr:hypothetical protein [Chloroflexota bacterium]MYD73105.1 hypothetical protein [Chloroflexota bacterium]MYF81467.1 hypothetical protein [Chloroflexota bacterium]MYI04288.1 hypothetical protein [Chloroflexota bacterium]